MQTDPQRIPVIVGVGEHVDRPEHACDALEPLSLMERALRAADADAGGGWLGDANSLELVGLMSWRYENPVAQLCDRVGLPRERGAHASMGGETPVRLIHDAALRITRGQARVALIVGGEAQHARARARKENVSLPWTPQASRERATQFASSRFALSGVAKQLRAWDPAQIYPFYEMATQARWRLTPAQGQQASATLWARYAEVAANNPSAWIREMPDATRIATVGDDNRLINWPYPKLMTANPNVNQAAAIIVTSLASARAAGLPDAHIVHVWGGAAAHEPEDYLLRDRYDRSTAQSAVLAAAVRIGGGSAARFGKMELYSCFPVVPKMALHELGLDAAHHSPTVTGGLTFFGGPLNNYMSHAACAMVRALRAAPSGEVGLLYGQGGYVNKHHALVVSRTPPPAPLALDYSVQPQADAAREPVPPLAESYTGPARIETYTISYARDGLPLHGLVILRTEDGRRTMAQVPADDVVTLQHLASTEHNAIGLAGQVRTDVFGMPVFAAGPPRDSRARPRRYCKVEREGALTIVTIDRPASMNALHPPCNAELAEIFDDFSADPTQWVAILTGAGDKAFSSGNDLSYTARALARGETLAVPLSGFAGLTARFDLNKPVIAAVNGLALGGGFEIALACDLIIAADTASFGLPEPRVGLAALAGGLLRLPRLIGEKHAMGMILTGRRISAAEGASLGFVNAVVAPDQLMAEARQWAAQIMANSPMSVRASKELVRMGLQEPSLPVAYARQADSPAVRALFRSADFREGPLAFSQKRAPKWEGR